MNDGVVKGWVCPLCGKANAPWVSECNCAVPRAPEFYPVPVIGPFFTPQELPSIPWTICNDNRITY